MPTAWPTPVDLPLPLIRFCSPAEAHPVGHNLADSETSWVNPMGDFGTLLDFAPFGRLDITRKYGSHKGHTVPTHQRPPSKPRLRSMRPDERSAQMRHHRRRHGRRQVLRTKERSAGRRACPADKPCTHTSPETTRSMLPRLSRYSVPRIHVRHSRSHACARRRRATHFYVTYASSTTAVLVRVG